MLSCRAASCRPPCVSWSHRACVLVETERFHATIRFHSSSSDDNDASSDHPPPSRRRRHSFTDSIPSFQEFQKITQIKSLYRKFVRLSTAQPEILTSIRREFRIEQPDSWHVQRAISEGSRRYKELSSMMSTLSTRPSSSSQKSVVWPWQRPQTTKQPPTPFPKKSSMSDTDPTTKKTSE